MYMMTANGWRPLYTPSKHDDNEQKEVPLPHHRYQEQWNKMSKANKYVELARMTIFK